MKLISSLFLILSYLNYISAQEIKSNFACEKPEERKDLPFSIDTSKHMCRKDIEDKKEGWYTTGLPLLNSDPNEGFGYGLGMFVFQNGFKSDPLFEYTPYRTKVFLQLFNTTKNAQYHQLSFDLPFFLNSKWRLRTDFYQTITPTTLYFGIGESSMNSLWYYTKNQPGAEIVNNANYSEQEQNLQYMKPGSNESPIRIHNSVQSGFSERDSFRTTDTLYNRYHIEMPQVAMSTERSFWDGRIRLVSGLRGGKNIIKTFDGKWVDAKDPLLDSFPINSSGKAPNDKTRLTEDWEANKILGYYGGYVNTLRLGIVFDTRDFEPDPNRGVFWEATFEKASKHFGSDFNFQKYFIHSKFFYSPFPNLFHKLVLASRFGFIVSSGDVPFFEYRNMWGTEGNISGLGGLRILRGYKQDRFIGRSMGFGNLEIRWKFFQFRLGDELFALNLVPFFDFGRVWDDEHKLGLIGYNYSKGLGFRIAWNQSTIIMIDYAISREDRQLFVNFNHSF
ncbi:MAG: BamA/TamA family outer membrane protein [Leptospiraceae bacterium]|nr:BamA/TamA family outer membrane protein [Leptospiraceae bacterium]MCP5511284.1 BamA/TamA family outer membrane protein [Leptospiraceae bacterium]